MAANEIKIKIQVARGSGVDPNDVDQRASKGEFEGHEENHDHRTISQFVRPDDEFEAWAIAAKKANAGTTEFFDMVEKVVPESDEVLDKVATGLGMDGSGAPRLYIGIYDADQ
jgi:hypothetical protein